VLFAFQQVLHRSMHAALKSPVDCLSAVVVYKVWHLCCGLPVRSLAAHMLSCNLGVKYGAGGAQGRPVSVAAAAAASSASRFASGVTS
jgi:hypothetical protein